MLDHTHFGGHNPIFPGQAAPIKFKIQFATRQVFFWFLMLLNM